jgi:serpin B
MRLAFGGRPDFSGVAPPPLFITDVVQQAWVEVNEEGTEAAAATRGDKAKGEKPESGHMEFRADRPFLFLIRDTRSGTILFMGRLTNPAA